jgi:hypothetical protein
LQYKDLVARKSPFLKNYMASCVYSFTEECHVQITEAFYGPSPRRFKNISVYAESRLTLSRGKGLIFLY